MLVISVFTRTALGVVLAIGLAPSYISSVGAADPIVGTWSGTVDQPGEGSYKAVMTLTSPSGGSSSYPSLNCGGRLSGGGSGGVYRFNETITFGRATETSDGCIDGSIEIIVRGDTLDWSWSGSWQGKSYFVSGTLFRSGPTPSGSAKFVIKKLYAGPFIWGAPAHIKSCFGERPWTKFKVVESNVGGPLLFEVKVDQQKWRAAFSGGQSIIGQNVWLRARAAGSGGYVKVKVTGSCIGL